jgi:3D (Asp-Asp-Asp) domain-containing protein
MKRMKRKLKKAVLGLAMMVSAAVPAKAGGKKATNIPQARITVYWKNSDSDTRQLKSSTGVRLHQGHVAVDPKVIPYGSTVKIKGWGEFVAVDTGSAVKSRKAAKAMGKDVPVVDVFFLDKDDALKAAENKPIFAQVEVVPPSAS